MTYFDATPLIAPLQCPRRSTYKVVTSALSEADKTASTLKNEKPNSPTRSLPNVRCLSFPIRATAENNRVPPFHHVARHGHGPNVKQQQHVQLPLALACSRVVVEHRVHESGMCSNTTWSIQTLLYTKSSHSGPSRLYSPAHHITHKATTYRSISVKESDVGLDPQSTYI